MNYYLIKLDNPEEKLRWYKNSRAASFTKNYLNSLQDEDLYDVVTSDEPIIVARVGHLKL